MFDAAMAPTSAAVTHVAEAFSLLEYSTGIDIHGDLLPGGDPLAGPLTGPLTAPLTGPLSGVIGALKNTPAAPPAPSTPVGPVGSVGSSVVPAITGSLAASVSGLGILTGNGPGGGNPGSGLASGAVTPQQLVPQRVADPVQLASLHGLPLLQQLALLPGGSISDFVSQHPGSIDSVLAAPPQAREVELWWSGLGIDARSALATSAPYLVGNLEGVPFTLRDLANRRYLEETLTAVREAVAHDGRSEAIDAERQLHMLEQISAALVTPEGEPQRRLLNLDAEGTGTAAIVIGDVQTADYVAFLVPGMFYTVDGQMVNWTTAAQDLYDVETTWVDKLGATDRNLKGATVATVAWIGYETPSLVNFASLDLAYAGRDAIAKAVDGLRTQRGEDQPYLSLVAHSYGSTAAMMALTDFGIDIDSIALIGSPGSAAKTAKDLGVPGDNVYVGEAAWDQVKDSAFFGSDPGSEAFGAHLFSVDGGVDPLTGKTLGASVGHDQYLAAGSESLRNLGLVALGQGRLVTTDSGAAIVSKGEGAIRQR